MASRESADADRISVIGYWIFGVAVALNAAGAMIVEITAGRLLAPYFGMSLYTWTTIIGIVLAGLAVGHWLGGVLADRFAKSLKLVIGVAFLVGAVLTVMILPITRIVALSIAGDQNPLAVSILLTAVSAFLLPSLAAGVVQPLATTHVVQMGGSGKGRYIGQMLAAGAIGSILGTFLAGFFFISQIGSVGTIWMVAAVNVLLAAIFLTKPLARVLGLFAGGVMGYAAVSGLAPAAFAIPCEWESQYYCIRIDPADGITGRPSRLLALDHLVHSMNDEKDPAYFASPYVHLVDEIARRKFADGSFSAFFIGGGGYTLPRGWLSRYPEMRLTIAEIDPKVTQLAEQELWFKTGPNVTVKNADGRVALALESKQRRFDVIFGDAFHDIAIPAHLITDEFHQLVISRLSPKGFYVLNVVDDPAQPRLLASLVATLRERFTAVEVWTAPDDLQGARRATFIVYAAMHASGLPREFEATRGQARSWWRIGLRPERIDRLGVFLTDDFAPIDRLMSRLWFLGD